MFGSRVIDKRYSTFLRLKKQGKLSKKNERRVRKCLKISKLYLKKMDRYAKSAIRTAGKNSPKTVSYINSILAKSAAKTVAYERAVNKLYK